MDAESWWEGPHSCHSILGCPIWRESGHKSEKIDTAPPPWKHPLLEVRFKMKIFKSSCAILKKSFLFPECQFTFLWDKAMGLYWWLLNYVPENSLLGRDSTILSPRLQLEKPEFKKKKKIPLTLHTWLQCKLFFSFFLLYVGQGVIQMDTTFSIPNWRAFIKKPAVARGLMHSKILQPGVSSGVDL